PPPNAFDESLAAEIVARFALRRELVLHDLLGGDAGVVGADLPQRVVAAHAVVTDQRVHDRLLERVAHVQRARHVRRRQQDAVRLTAAARREAASLLPARIPLRFDLFALETLVHAKLESGTDAPPIMANGWGIVRARHDVPKRRGRASFRRRPEFSDVVARM